jgi:protein phosphatase
LTDETPKDLSVFAAAGATDVGLQRAHNEDSFQLLRWLDLYVVADGMGGHRSGDVASRLATESIAEAFQEQMEEAPTVVTKAAPVGGLEKADEAGTSALVSAVRTANQRIYEHGLRNPSCRGMGTTVVAASYFGPSNQLHIAHVGDSRAYRIRASELRQLTRDHSLYNEYVSQDGALTARELAEIPRNVITRALGVGPRVEVDLTVEEPRPGDLYLLCSDGLHGMLSDAEILAISLSTDEGDPDRLCERLVESANDHGGDDNITVVAFRFGELGVAPTQRAPSA